MRRSAVIDRLATTSTDRAAPIPVCPICDGAGFYTLPVPASDPRFGRLNPCDCRRVGGLLPAQRRRLETLRGELGRYADCTFASFNVARPCFAIDWAGQRYEPQTQAEFLVKAAAKCEAFAREPQGWIFLFGPTGSGKSHLAAAIANAVAQSGGAASYAPVSSLIEFVRDGYADHSSSDRMRDLQSVELLVLDDLGTEQAGDRNATLLFQMLNGRYSANRPTVITSNVHPRQLDARLDDRIAEMTGGVLWLPVSSHRRIEQMLQQQRGRR